MIFISAGHYPEKPGACFEGFCEHAEAVSWAKTIAMQLLNFGATADLVPVGKLKDKVDFINSRGADLAVEIHFNSDPKHAGRGCETLHYPSSPKGIRAAKLAQSFMADVMGNDRGIKVGYYQMDPSRGVDHFLRATDCPSLIIEPEFIHNKDIIQENKQECSEEIAKALAIFLTP